MFSTTMFVPSTEGGELLKRLEEVESNIQEEVIWRPKLIEKSGQQLSYLFRSKVPITEVVP